MTGKAFSGSCVSFRLIGCMRYVFFYISPSLIAVQIPEQAMDSPSVIAEQANDSSYFTYVFSANNSHNLGADEIEMVNESLSSLVTLANARVDVLCQPSSMCEDLDALTLPIRTIPVTLPLDNFVIAVELAKLWYVRRYPQRQSLYFETDMLFLRDPMQAMRAGFERRTCDVILGFGPDTIGDVNSGLVYFRHDVGALRLIEQTVRKLTSMSYVRGGDNQKVIAQLGFHQIAPGDSRTRNGSTVCSQGLRDIQLYSIYTFEDKSPAHILKLATDSRVAVIHFNGKSATKVLMSEIARFSRKSLIAEVAMFLRDTRWSR
eukprot:TRINITY_DN50368_c0_g1_i1.p1 TRINITY_DN50368_c0_g1~~TRINITY_DN50368_c0_g1_i1.p1  ORF type:complete len:318 (+),score=22.51 TRINITY_DN50368_c0_g1_i1:59-1012(+)